VEQKASDPDVFVVDCEGVNSLGEATAILKQATFALAQMASMIVQVMKGQVNQQNISDVRAQFVLSRAFTRKLPGFSIGTTIMMREVGVRLPKGRKPSIAERNEM
jgi:ribosomal protein L35AE/L33A